MDVQSLSFLHPHSLPADKVCSLFQATKNQGLSDAQVLSRAKRFGRNVLPDPDHLSPLAIFMRQFKSTIVLILLIAAIISYIYNHILDVYIILGVVIANAVVGFIQEFQAERSIEALKHLIIPKISVKRAGKEIVVSSHELVPGDIILLSEGDHVPADARLLDCENLQSDESSLTGESLPAVKDTEPVDEKTPVAERKNMVWMGSAIVAGKAKAIVVATGTFTILGKIARSLKDMEEKDDHFKIKTNELANQMGIIAVVSVFLIFVVGLFVRHFEFEEILMFSIASLVSAIPEGLPVILTIVLALSAKRMVRKNALVRRLSATETLAVVNLIITDKTGTLTENNMTVKAVCLPFQPKISIDYDNNKARIVQDGRSPTDKHYPLQKLLDIAGSCHGVQRIYQADGEEVFQGDPTEVALVTLADQSAKSNSYYQQTIQVLNDMPFSQRYRWRASFVNYKENPQKQIFTVGSPETVLGQCRKVLLPDHKEHPLDHERLKHIESQVNQLSTSGMRVLALAYKDTGTLKTVENEDISEMVFVGLVGIIDPPRPESKEAISQAHKAGIGVIMATGDHPVTAGAIGVELGLLDSKKIGDQVMNETEFATLSDTEAKERIGQVRIFARMTPESKLRLAKLYQELGYVVAMTGDGVNDAPALKQADIGISMGKNGTDVAREASDIVLADDNFATIVAAVEEGRTQFRNVRRTSFFYIINNLAETLSLVIFLLIGLPIPLLPKQILWLNLVTAGVTDMALAAEKSHDDVLTSRPKKRNEPILNRQLIPYLLFTMFIIVTLSVVFFISYQSQSIEKARTIVFIILCLSQLYNIYNMRSIKRSIFTVGIFSSKTINLAVLVSFTLMTGVIYLPGIREVFEFAHVSFADLLICIAATAGILGFGEIYKKKLMPKAI